MKTFINAVKKAEKVSTKVEKFEALQGLSEIGKILMIEALSAYRVFGVKKYDMPSEFAREDSDVSFFISLLDGLHSRKITGNAAREAVTNTLGMFTVDTASYLMRVLAKDLKAGFSETTLNKIYPNLVPTYDVMLAFPVDHTFDWNTWPKLVQIKYNGLRCNAPTSSKEGTRYISRSGKDASHLEGLFDEELMKIRDHLGYDIMPDGESMGSSFKESMKAKGKDNLSAKKNNRFYLFDIMSQEEWDNKNCKMTQKERTALIETLCKDLSLQLILPAESVYVNNRAEVQALYEKAIGEGCEGVMIKDPEGRYEWKRSKNWWKLKPTETFDGVIVGFEEGRGRNSGTLGALIVEGVLPTGERWRTAVGTGFKPDKEMRDEIWSNKEKYNDVCVEIKGDPNLSMAEGSDIYSITWPRFSKFRFDKNS